MASEQVLALEARIAHLERVVEKTTALLIAQDEVNRALSGHADAMQKALVDMQASLDAVASCLHSQAGALPKAPS